MSAAGAWTDVDCSEMDWLSVGLLLVVSYVLTSILVSYLQRYRLRRIERKSEELCAATEAAVDDAARVPITLITGFLGSGKTTLVNRVLSSPDHGLRVLVIENELGAVSIDHELIDRTRQASMPEGVIVLKNGCMCCSGETPGSELERVLDKLLEMGRLGHHAPKADDAAAAAPLPFDYVLIETTGLADPSPLVQVLARREMERSPFYLDAVIAMVDAAHCLRHLQPSGYGGPFGFARRRAEAEKQLAMADRIVLNKMDLLQQPRAGAAADASKRPQTSVGGAVSEESVIAAVRGVNASAAILRCRHAEVPLLELLNLRAFSSANWLRHLREEVEQRTMPYDAKHSASVSCIAMSVETPIALPKLQVWLQQLIEARHDDVYRLKGVLSIDESDERFVLHGVHADVHGHFERPWAPGEQRVSSMVVIGHKLDREALTRSFEATVAADALDETAPCGACVEPPAAEEVRLKSE